MGRGDGGGEQKRGRKRVKNNSETRNGLGRWCSIAEESRLRTAGVATSAVAAHTQYAG